MTVARPGGPLDVAREHVVRTVGFPVMIGGVLTGGGNAPSTTRWVNIDEAATRGLHAAGFLRLTLEGAHRHAA